MRPPFILDLFAGPGGWDEGMRSIGITDVVGLEWDAAACATRAAAGHRTIRTDVAVYPTAPFVGKVRGLIASPPCQAWSMAGKGAGRGEVDRVHAAVELCRNGWTDEPLSWPWVDPRTPLILQPLRWAWDLRESLEWIACEQVPPALGVWQHVADVLRSWGYQSDAKILCAADYGVPQTRDRAFLLASSGVLRWPESSHGDRPEPSLFGRARNAWVSMADALGWDGELDRRQTGAPPVGTDKPSPTVVGSALAKGVWVFRGGNQDNAARRRLDQPAPTLVFGHAGNEIGWVPGPDLRVNKEGRPPTVEEATVLQGFSRSYPWQGTKTKQYEQVGNVVCPPVAAAIVGTLDRDHARKAAA